MMGFAKIAGGAPSAVRAMANHLMNATLRPEESRLAAYYSLGMVQPDQEAPLTKRELRNAQHVDDWLAGKVKPDLVRLAEYAMTQDAHLTPTEIEWQLTRDLERAIDATDGGAPLSPEAQGSARSA